VSTTAAVTTVAVVNARNDQLLRLPLLLLLVSLLLLLAAAVATTDAQLARAIMVKHFKVFPDRSMFYPPQDPTVSKVLSCGITFAK
jgi:hypothetical protein